MLIIVIDSKGTPITVAGDNSETDFNKVRVLSSLVGKLLDAQNNTGKMIKDQYNTFRNAQKRKIDEFEQRTRKNMNSGSAFPTSNGFSASPKSRGFGEGDEVSEHVGDENSEIQGNSESGVNVSG